MRFKIFLLLCLFDFSSSVFAKVNCPDGMVPIGGGGVAGCMSIESGQNTALAQSRGRWVTRWGTIAADLVNGFFGGANNFSNKRQAQKVAIAQCKANGGAACKLKFSYFNQCGVIAWGDNAFPPQSAENIRVASEWALEECNGLTANCKIVYADCSLPVWVQ